MAYPFDKMIPKNFQYDWGWDRKTQKRLQIKKQRSYNKKVIIQGLQDEKDWNDYMYELARQEDSYDWYKDYMDMEMEREMQRDFDSYFNMYDDLYNNFDLRSDFC